MGLKLVINVSKKIPGKQDYSSIMSSCSIESEIAIGQDPVAEAARLQGQAQAAVDQFLGISPMPQPALQAAPQMSLQATTGTSQQRSVQPASRGTSQPYTNGRRAPAAISPAQLRYLRQLCDRTPGALDRICAEHQVGALDDLGSRVASGIIESLQTVSR